MESTPDTMPLAHFESLGQLEGTYWWHVTRRRIAREWLAPHSGPHPRLLDLGCGTGGFLEHLARELHASRAVGIDVSSTAMRMSADKPLELVQADLAKPVTVEAGGFDVVTMMDVLEHLPSEQPALETARINLRPGGFFLASVPASPWLYSSWDRMLQHYRRYVRHALVAVVGESGLRILRCSRAFSFAVVPAIFRRVFDRPTASSDCIFPPVSRLTNSLLLSLGAVEARILRHGRLPLGLSLFILAQKPEEGRHE